MDIDKEQIDELYNVDKLDLYSPSVVFENLILDVKGASELFGVSTKTIYRHLDEIPHKRIGNKIKFLLPDLISWFKN